MSEMDEPSGWFLTRLFHNEYKTITIPRNRSVTIGRDNNESVIAIPTTMFKHVSRKHCVIEVIGGNAVLTDRFSSGGTYVGDRRLCATHPGTITLQEGDMVGIGTHTNDTDHFYKKNSNVLFYRVCRTANLEDLIVVSDDDDHDTDVLLPFEHYDRGETELCPGPDNLKPCVSNPARRSTNRQSAALDNNEHIKEDEPVTLNTGLLSIPEERLANLVPNCSWEEEYDRIVNVTRKPDVDDSTAHVFDDEYTDQQYSQLLLENMKQELVDDSDQYDCDETSVPELLDDDEENSYNRWRLKLDKSDLETRVGKAKPGAGHKTIDRMSKEPEPEQSRSRSKPPPGKRGYDAVDDNAGSGTIDKSENSIQQSNMAIKKPTHHLPSVTEINIFEAAGRAPLEKEPAKPARGFPKRRASVCLSGFESFVAKQRKRRGSVSDRCPVKAAAQPISAWKKQARSERLKEIAEHGKQYSAPTVEQIKTGLTKPRVKYTENNRGIFLTTPVAIQPKPLPRSRPAIEEDIVCTQSTTLEPLGSAVAVEDIAPVVSIRPAKMTFKSVEMLSNVDRPVSAVPGKILQRRCSIADVAIPDDFIAKKLKTSASITTSKAVMGPPSNTPSTSSFPQTNSTTGRSAQSSTKEAIVKPTLPKSAFQTQPSTSTYVPVKTKIYNRLKGILKHPSKISKKGTSKRVIFAESHETIIVSRYLDDRSMQGVPVAFAETVQQKEKQALSEIVGWGCDWLEATNGGPFDEQEKLLQLVESYPNLHVFRETMQPILMRELWQDIRSQYSLKLPLSFITLDNVHAQQTQFNLCQITCKAFIKNKLKHLPWSSEVVLLHYVSKTTGGRLRLFAYVCQRYRDSSSNGSSASSEAGEWINLIMLATLGKLEELATGSHFKFCPITSITPHLRDLRALQLLEYSPLLENILSPVQNNSVLVAPGKGFVDKPDMREAILARTEPGALNKVQMDVVLSVLDECSRWDEPSISLIQGPPGTGKSHVISHIALHLLDIECTKRVKVLICAQSNAAVDVIAKRLICLRNAKDPKAKFNLVRIGTREKVDNQCLSVFIDELVKRRGNLAEKEINNNMVENYRQTLMTVEGHILHMEKNLECDANKNRSRLEEWYSQRTELKKKLSEAKSKGFHSTAEINTIRREIIEHADIVCTTLGSCSHLAKYYPQDKYDVCIIDEATQCTEVCSLSPLEYGMQKMILVGDINQLPATVLDQQSIKAGFRQSLFSRLQNAGGAKIVKMLMVQYRMDPEICLWPNEYFYMRRLTNDPSTKASAIQARCNLKPYLVVSLTYDQELTQVEHEIYNRDEIAFVVGLLKCVVQHCKKESTIAIITPYQRHKAEVVGQLRLNNLKQVQVHSIDSVQGKEYDVVIVSLARSNGAGFLNTPERINVALTRARRCLVLCGNFACLKQKPVWKSLLQNAEARGLFVHTQGNTIGDEINSVMRQLVQK